MCCLLVRMHRRLAAAAVLIGSTKPSVQALVDQLSCRICAGRCLSSNTWTGQSSRSDAPSALETALESRRAACGVNLSCVLLGDAHVSVPLICVND
jgi:hypothetical protein